MTSESNAGFHHHYHQQGVMFKSSGAMSSSSSSGSGGCEMISMGNYYGNPGGIMNLAVNDGATGGGMVFSSGGSPNSLSSSTLLLDSVPGLKHDTGLAVEWGIEEQYKLEEGLRKYANEPKILMYIKIAASLGDKTVRDVALRCRWMTSKRRKHEDQSLVKKVKDQRDKLIDSSLRSNMSPASSMNAASCSFISNHHNQSNLMFSEAMSGTARHLLEENKQAFGQISANLSALKLQENVNLFFHTRNNITTILNDMSNMPGIMSRMPPLPVLLNEELASSVFPHSSQICAKKIVECGMDIIMDNKFPIESQGDFTWQTLTSLRRMGTDRHPNQTTQNILTRICFVCSNSVSDGNTASDYFDWDWHISVCPR